MIHIVVHHFGKVQEATEIALASERYHQRNNDPVPQPKPLYLDVEYVECPRRHDYGDSLNRLWRIGEGFINLEHDVAPWPGALTELWECKMKLCMFPILVKSTLNITNFGCIKFSSELIARTKDIWDNYPRNDVFKWDSLDSYFHQILAERYLNVQARAHVHFPPVLHVNWAHCGGVKNAA